MQLKKQKIISLIICILFVCTAAFSVFFIEEKSHHKCSGKDCPVCESLHYAEIRLEHCGGDSLNVPDFTFPYFNNSILCFSLCITLLKDQSLVSQKVRLNN